MLLFTSPTAAQSFLKKGSAVALGNYDGVHFGHRAILKQLKQHARAHKLKSLLLTFDPHPAKLLAPRTDLKLINTRDQKCELLRKTGIDVVLILRFNKKFAQLSHQDFFEKILVKKLNARFVIVGHDFTFGRQRAGTTETLEALGRQHCVDVRLVSAQIHHGVLVSSSVIRNLIREGNVTLANKLLTRSFFVDGTVIHGHHRGRALGVHTANIKARNELLPADGVYATWAIVENKHYASVTNIGLNPTFADNKLSVECHILNFNRDIYHRKIRVIFEKRIRDEIQFASPTKLARQIQKDIVTAKKILL
jgi:riboflavin kinase/FMN adenylyltransferase